MTAFNYPELITISHLDRRWYVVDDDTILPSITTVLAGSHSAEFTASIERWRDSMGHEKADAYTKSRADHGTVVHLLIERFLKGEDPYAPIDGADPSDLDVGAFNALKLKLKKVDQVWGQEVALYSRRLGIAGRCDCIGVYKGVPCIIDFKTSGRIKGEVDIEDYRYQLAFYAAAHNELFGTEIKNGVILMVSQGGTPQEFHVELPAYEAKLPEKVRLFWTTLETAK